MAQWYYTDVWRQRFGPVDDAGLLDLNGSGWITGDTHVWRDGMDDWLPFKSVAEEVFPKDEEGHPPRLAVCAHSGKVVPKNDTVTYGRALIAVDSKRDFVQTLMETGRTSIDDATETKTRYVGFWWRTLGIFLDEMIKLVLMGVAALIFFALGALISALFSVSFDGISDGASVVVGILVIVAIVLTYATTAIYEVWMVGKHQSTLGKMAIGARIFRPDESKVSYKRSLGRWAVKFFPLELVKIMLLFSTNIPLMLIGLAVGAADSKVMQVASVFMGIVLPIAVFAAISSVFWMAAYDPEKRALHDRIASTRVIRK